MRPHLLDLYCCQGGASRGYQLAGFCVTGVDINPQPRYCGDEFIQADAVAWMEQNMAFIRETFHAVSGGPPCQRYSLTQRIRGNEHPDLIGRTRELFEATGLPYVIENVEEARSELRNPVMLCGGMFGLRTYRHRLFETGGGFSFPPPEHPAHTAPLRKMGRPVRPGEFMHVVGNFSGAALAREVMGMPWASRDGLREAIPPAYTRYIGEHLMKALEER